MSKLQYQHWKHVLQSSCCSLYSPCKSNFSSQVHCHMVHCKDTIPKIWNKYSQERNIGVSVLIATFMSLWANYIFPRWVCLFCWRKYVDRSWEYINRSQTHECGNWGWGRAIPRKGIYKRNCRCSAHIFRRLADTPSSKNFGLFHWRLPVICPLS